MTECADKVAVVWHEKGSFHVQNLSDLLEVNVMHCMRGEPGYVILDLLPTMHLANERKREIVRQKKEVAG